MRTIKYLLFVVGLFCIAESNAQVNLRLGQLVGLPAVVHVGDSFSVSITIHNDSAATFSGSFNFKGLIDTTVVTADTIFTSTLNYQNPLAVESILGGDSITRSLIIKINNPPFIIGSSGVVIWPIVTSNQQVHISDSLVTLANVLYPVGVDEITAKKLKVYMNGQQLMVQDKGEYLLQDVKLFDVTGNLLQAQQFSASGVFDMNKYSSGVYLAQITFADNTRAVIRVVYTK